MPEIYGTDTGAATGRFICAGALRLAYRLNVLNANLVPATGPVILAANHIGALDGALIIAASPRPIFTVAKSGIFVPVIDNILRWGGLIPIEYDQADRKAILASLAVLDRGGVLGLFPEGHRGGGRIATMRSGISYLALRSGATVVPLTLFGTRRTGQGKNSLPLPGSRLDVVFGVPFLPEPRDWHRRSEMALSAGEIQSRLADEVQRAMACIGRSLPEDDLGLD